jgi:hypothetical protein
MSAVRTATGGPYDSEEPMAERLGLSSGRVDFGSLRIPIPARAQLQVEKGNGDLLRAVHVLVPSGRVSLSALAAPRSNALWRGLAGEIGESLSNDGARVRTEWGEWGREVQAESNGAISRFVGVDGPRWMLYGVATGPADGADDLGWVLREMMRGTVVFRGPDPLPVKTVLPLRLPEGLEERIEQAREVSAHAPSRTAARTAQPRGIDPAARANGTRSVGTPGAVPPARQPMAPRRSIAPIGPPAQHPPVGRPAPGYPPDAMPAVAALPPAGATIGSLGAATPYGRPSAPNALPPVPAASRWTAVEETWTGANPVVNADQLAQQPAWALLGAAPSFWPDERYRRTEPPESVRPAPEPSPLSGLPSDFGISGSLESDFPDPTPLEREILAGMAFGGLGSATDFGAGAGAGGHVNGSGPGRPAEQLAATADEVDGGAWSGPDSALLSSTDGLHAVLTHDAAATRGWAARRSRHRQP